MKGLIFDIKRYSINDGPGIRTTIFLKGCPLKCLWCHNPESQSTKPQFFFYKDKCIHCNLCINSCDNNALSFDDGILNRESCSLCFRCEEVCPSLSIKAVGKYYDSKEILDIVSKDMHFYGDKGGVTFSGGEPLLQYEFLLEALKLLKNEGFNTAVDTSGFADTEKILRIAEYTDIFLYDIKHFDNEKHKLLTGIENQLILKNIKELANTNSEIVVRIPVIPKLTDDKNNLRNIKSFISSLSDKIKIETVFYHNIMEGKYELCGMEYTLKDIDIPDENYKKEKSEILGVCYETKN